MPTTRSLLTSFVLVLFACATVFAQAAPVTGRVVDPQGASVANATVTLTPLPASSLEWLQA